MAGSCISFSTENLLARNIMKRLFIAGEYLLPSTTSGARHPRECCDAAMCFGFSAFPGQDCSAFHLRNAASFRVGFNPGDKSGSAYASVLPAGKRLHWSGRKRTAFSIGSEHRGLV